MTKKKTKVHLICQRCAEINGGQWKPTNIMVNLALGPCNVCKEIVSIIQVQHWKGLSVSKDFIPYNVKKKRDIKAPKVNIPKPNTEVLSDNILG